MAKRLPHFSKEERKEIEGHIKRLNPTLVRLIESILSTINESSESGETSALRRTETNFLFAVANCTYPGERISIRLVKALELTADKLKEDGNPAGTHLDALALAIRMRLKRSR